MLAVFAGTRFAAQHFAVAGADVDVVTAAVAADNFGFVHDAAVTAAFQLGFNDFAFALAFGGFYRLAQADRAFGGRVGFCPLLRLRISPLVASMRISYSCALSNSSIS